MKETEKVLARFIVSGFVQGVGYRFFVYKSAIPLNINGYAKNLYDGTVEVVAEGTFADIEQLHKQLKIGPSRSDVKSVSISFDEFRDLHKDFSIK